MILAEASFSIARLRGFTAKYRFAILLAALLILFISAPLAEIAQIERGQKLRILTIVYSVLLISAAFAVARSRVTLWISALLVGPAIALDIVDFFAEHDWSQFASHVLATLFLGYVATLILIHIFTSSRVNADIIFAALNVYLLIGVLWAMVYSMVEMLSPGSFYYSLAAQDDANLRFGTEGTSLSLYFSFVTMTTLGYGDIIPATPATKSLATLQALLGQMQATADALSRQSDSPDDQAASQALAEAASIARRPSSMRPRARSRLPRLPRSTASSRRSPVARASSSPTTNSARARSSCPSSR